MSSVREKNTTKKEDTAMQNHLEVKSIAQLKDYARYLELTMGSRINRPDEYAARLNEIEVVKSIIERKKRIK